MQVTLMKGKIHRARVTEADLHYEGSISIDRRLIEAAGFFVNERVDVYNIDTGARFSTYVIKAPAGSGTVGLNGAAARLAMLGDKVIIVAYANFDETEARSFQPCVVIVDENNKKNVAGVLTASFYLEERNPRALDQWQVRFLCAKMSDCRMRFRTDLNS